MIMVFYNKSIDNNIEEGKNLFIYEGAENEAEKSNTPPHVKHTPSC